MGLTSRSTGVGIFRSAGVARDATRSELVVALAGNPNTGKSTVFNGLTGLRQHTGNWPGKTVTVASGRYTHDGNVFLLVDLPGTYSLLTNSAEEEVARDFLLSGRPDATVVVADAACLERNLNLALQVIEITPRTVLCVNLIDEARKSGITVDVPSLERGLGIPVVATAARSGAGLDDLKKAIAGVATGLIRPEPVPVPYSRRVLQAARRLAPAILGLGFDERGARWLAMNLLDSSGATRDSLLRFIAGRSADGTGTGGS
ncbi:MAG: FeoB small GTPase domain-containing protein [Ignavibacteriales bacterium]